MSESDENLIRVLKLANAESLDIEQRISRMMRRGYEFVQGWSVAVPSRAVVHAHGAVDVITFLVFKRVERMDDGKTTD